MATIRSSKFFSSGLALALLVGGSALGCGSAPVTAAADARSSPEPRKPDGVVLDPPPALPLAVDRAGARGVVALREPLGDDALFEVVHAYINAFQHEDIELLIQLLAQDAVSLDPKGPRSRGAIVDAWRARFRNLDYRKLQGTEVVDMGSIERYTVQNFGSPSAPPRPPEMRDGDVLLRIPVAGARLGGERYFGDVIVMLLRRDAPSAEGAATKQHYRIAALSEEDAP